MQLKGQYRNTERKNHCFHSNLIGEKNKQTKKPAIKRKRTESGGEIKKNKTVGEKKTKEARAGTNGYERGWRRREPGPTEQDGKRE